MTDENLTGNEKRGSIGSSNTTDANMKLRTIKVRVRTWRTLRLLAAHRDGTMVAVLDELVARELKSAKQDVIEGQEIRNA